MSLTGNTYYTITEDYITTDNLQLNNHLRSSQPSLICNKHSLHSKLHPCTVKDLIIKGEIRENLSSTILPIVKIQNHTAC